MNNNKRIVTLYHVYQKNHLGILEKHPDYDRYGYENREQIVQQILSNHDEYQTLYIIESIEVQEL